MQEYVDGVGDLNAEFWLGLDHIHSLTVHPRKVQLDVVTEHGEWTYVQFSNFSVAGPPDYTTGYTGGEYGWWFNSCGLTNINAEYQQNTGDERFSVYCGGSHTYIILSILKIQ